MDLSSLHTFPKINTQKVNTADDCILYPTTPPTPPHSRKGQHNKNIYIIGTWTQIWQCVENSTEYKIKQTEHSRQCDHLLSVVTTACVLETLMWQMKWFFKKIHRFGQFVHNNLVLLWSNEQFNLKKHQSKEIEKKNYSIFVQAFITQIFNS